MREIDFRENTFCFSVFLVRKDEKKPFLCTWINIYEHLSVNCSLYSLMKRCESNKLIVKWLSFLRLIIY